MDKFASLATFEKVAAENGYEVFTAEEIAAYYKDGLRKSINNELTSEEKEIFTADISFLQKSICHDENGKEVVRYYRPEQVKWEQAEDGTILKGIEGVYLDTPTNRKLNRVGAAYTAPSDILKSIEVDDDNDAIIKAMRTGRYADTPENRRLHRVGQPYGNKSGKKDLDPEKELEAVNKEIAAVAAGKTKLSNEKVVSLYAKRKELENKVKGGGAEDKKNVEHREAKEKERLGGIKGDEKLHERAGGDKKDKYEDKKEVDKREAKTKESLGGIKGDEKLHEKAEKKKKSGKVGEFSTGDDYDDYANDKDIFESAKKFDVEIVKRSDGTVGFRGTAKNVSKFLVDMDEDFEGEDMRDYKVAPEKEDDKKKSEVTPSDASKSFFESKFKNLKWKKGDDEDYPSVVAHKKFRGVPIDIEIDEDGQGEIFIGDADEGIEFGALTSEKAAKELWGTILEELEYYED